jgi:hypothetical protein
MTVAVDLSMTVFEVGIADWRWRLIERRRLNRDHSPASWPSNRRATS